MTEITADAYTKRTKMDGTMDSICLNCLATIEAGGHTTGGSYPELKHTCGPVFVERPGNALSPCAS
jgi:hypothetical protein